VTIDHRSPQCLSHAPAQIDDRHRAEKVMPLTFAALARLEVAVDRFVASMQPPEPVTGPVNSDKTIEGPTTVKGVLS
jgi:hypothetical protein